MNVTATMLLFVKRTKEYVKGKQDTDHDCV